MRTVTLRDAEVEVARAASLAEAGHDPEAVVILLYPDGSPFELYAAAMVPAVASSYGRLSVLRIDTGREPSAPARFGLSGAPGLVLFVGGRQVAAYAAPAGGGLQGPLGGAVQQILSTLGGLPGPGAGPKGGAAETVPAPPPLEIEGEALAAPAGGEGEGVELPGHGSCYICGRDNPGGLGLVFRLSGGRIRARFTLDERQQGPPRHAHGGCLSAVLDEAMGAAAWCAGHPVVAARLEVDFRRAVPLGVELDAEAWVVRSEGRKVWTESELRLPGGAVAARGRGLFIEARGLFEQDCFVPIM